MLKMLPSFASSEPIATSSHLRRHLSASALSPAMSLAGSTPLPDAAAPLTPTRLAGSSEAPQLSQPLLAVLAAALALLLFFVVKTHRNSARAALSGRVHPGRRHPGQVDEKHQHIPAPPVVTIPRHIQLSEAGHEAYARALEEHGDVIVVPRHGRLEYVVDYQHVKDVLTDSQSFSFEEAVTRMLHMRFMLWFKDGTFVSELDRLVQDGINPRLNAVVDKVSPIFVQEVEELFEKHAKAGADSEVVIDNLYTWVHRGIARAMVVLILGERYLDEQMTQRFMAVVGAIADLSGIYENTQGWAWAPALWSLKTTLGAICFTIVPQFFFSIVPLLWANRESHLNAGLDVESSAFAPFFDLLAARHRDRNTDRLSFLNFVWCAVVCLGIIFASVHQSAVMAVWCIANLAKRPEYIDEIRAEFDDVLETDAEGKSVLGLEGLRRSEKLDSFIREVLRTNSSLFAPVRYTTEPVRVGKYLIPKDALVAPYIKRAHELGDGAAGTGARFDGRQWVGNKAAVTGDPAFITFGLGRWACPGRQLAIAELKMITGILFAHYDVVLDGDELVPGDAMNRTSVGPTNTARIRKRAAAVTA